MLNQVSLSNEYQCILEMIDNDSKNKTEDYSIFEYVLPDLPDKSERDAEGNTLLHHAVNHKCVKIVEYMIQYQFDSTLLNNNGQTPLDLARTNNYQEIVTLLSSSEQSEVEVEEFRLHLNELKDVAISVPVPRRQKAQEFDFLRHTLKEDRPNLQFQQQQNEQLVTVQTPVELSEQLQFEIISAMEDFADEEEPLEHAKTHHMIKELQKALNPRSTNPNLTAIQCLLIELNTNPLLEIKSQGTPFAFVQAYRDQTGEQGTRVYKMLRDYLLNQGQKFADQALLTSLQAEKNQEQENTSALPKRRSLSFFDVASPDPQALAQAHESEIKEKVEYYTSEFFEKMKSVLEHLSTKLKNYILVFDENPDLTELDNQILDQMKKILNAYDADEYIQIDLWFDAYYLFIKIKERSNSVILATIENFQKQADTITKMLITTIYTHTQSAFSDHPNKMQDSMKIDVYATLASIIDGNVPDFQTFIDRYSQDVNLDVEPPGFMCLDTFIRQLMYCQERIKDLKQINDTKTLKFRT